MIVCRWCGAEYEWRDDANGAICPDCQNDAREEAREAMEAAAEEELWGETMEREVALLIGKK